MKTKQTGLALRGFLFACILCLVFAPNMAWAQETVKKATVSGQIVDPDGAPLVSQLLFTSQETSLRVNTDPFGRFQVRLPLGEYAVEISKGSLFERKQLSLSISDRKQIFLDNIALSRLYDTDWLVGDLHQHTIYSFDGSNSPYEVYLSDRSVGLDFGVVTDHNDVRADDEFIFGNDGFVGLPGIEITTDRGHFNAINFALLIDPDTSHAEADIRRIIECVRQDPDALLQINHPDRNEGGFGFKDWSLADDFDLMEVWNGKSAPPYVDGSPNRAAMAHWIEMIQNGAYLPATGGSDNHDISGNLMFMRDVAQTDAERFFNQSMFSGAPRTYVRAQTRTPAGILAALKRGNSFVTNNPLAFLTVGGAIPGETVQPGTQTASIRLESNRPLTAYRLRVNGADAPWIEVSGFVAEAAYPLHLDDGDFVFLEVCGAQGDYAFTNPVFAAE